MYEQKKGRQVEIIALNLIQPDPNQPRKTFQGINELSNSISDVGQIDPILVRQVSDGRYVIIDGERRYRAALASQAESIQCLVVDCDDPGEIRDLQYQANYFRAEFEPIDDAEALLEIKTRRGLTDEEIGKLIGKTRSEVSSRIQVANLPEEAKHQLRGFRDPSGRPVPRESLYLAMRCKTAEARQMVIDGILRGDRVGKLRAIVRDTKRANKTMAAIEAQSSPDEPSQDRDASATPVEVLGVDQAQSRASTGACETSDPAPSGLSTDSADAPDDPDNIDPSLEPEAGTTTDREDREVPEEDDRQVAEAGSAAGEQEGVEDCQGVMGTGSPDDHVIGAAAHHGQTSPVERAEEGSPGGVEDGIDEVFVRAWRQAYGHYAVRVTDLDSLRSLPGLSGFNVSGWLEARKWQAIGGYVIITTPVVQNKKVHQLIPVGDRRPAFEKVIASSLAKSSAQKK